MGDIADQHFGDMLAGDYDQEYDGYDQEYDGYYEGAPPPRCKFCGSKDVTWIHTGVRWRLFDADARNPHRCVRVAQASDFEDLGDGA